jgi:hypothetical protein
MDSPLSLPLGRWWIEGGNFGRSERHKLAALVRVPPDLRAILVAHVPLQFVDGRCLRSADDVQRHRLMGIAAEAPDLKVEISSV